MPEQNDDPKVNPNHIGRFPKGFARNEENAKRTDQLAEAIANDNENSGSINPDHLKVENEIAQYLDPTDGNWDIGKRQPGRYYVGVKRHPVIEAMYRRMGYQPVQGNDPEAMDYLFTDTTRVLGDVALYWTTQEIRDKWEAANIRKAIAVGAISLESGPETAWADDVNDPRSEARKLGAMAHARRDDAKLNSTIFSGTAGQIERLNRGIKEGNIPNFERSMRRG